MILDDYAKDGGEALLPKCTAFELGNFNEAIGVRLLNAIYLSKRILVAIFSMILYVRCA